MEPSRDVPAEQASKGAALTDALRWAAAPESERVVNPRNQRHGGSLRWFRRTLLGGRVCAPLADDPRVRAGVHRLPRFEVYVDLSLRLLSARSPGHGDIKGRLTHLPHTTFSRFKKVCEVAQQNRVRDSYPHGRKNARCDYRHIFPLPTDQDGVTNELRRAGRAPPPS